MLAFRAGKSNERADALSRKIKDTTTQSQVIATHRTQILLPQDKISDEVIQDLQLAPIASAISQEPSSSLQQNTAEYDSIELMDKLLSSNRTSLELEELRVKARTEKESIWQLRDGLLL